MIWHLDPSKAHDALTMAAAAAEDSDKQMLRHVAFCVEGDSKTLRIIGTSGFWLVISDLELKESVPRRLVLSMEPSEARAACVYHRRFTKAPPIFIDENDGEYALAVHSNRFRMMRLTVDFPLRSILKKREDVLDSRNDWSEMNPSPWFGPALLPILEAMRHFTMFRSIQFQATRDKFKPFLVEVSERPWMHIQAMPVLH